MDILVDSAFVRDFFILCACIVVMVCFLVEIFHSRVLFRLKKQKLERELESHVSDD